VVCDGAGVDAEFEKLLGEIFGVEFIETFKARRPAGWVDLMIAFESRKRAANPHKTSALNVSLPFSFIDFHKKHLVIRYHFLPLVDNNNNNNTHLTAFVWDYLGDPVQKGKTNLDFSEARDSGWQWHQLDHMQVCTLLQIDNHASILPLSFSQGRCPSCCPTNSIKALKVEVKNAKFTNFHFSTIGLVCRVCLCVFVSRQ